MKIAITGKGGVGKTTLSAVLARLYAEEGRSVLAVDADPDANLGLALGLAQQEIAGITPISEMSGLIAERTGASKENFGKFFKINPRVDDIPERFSKEKNGVRLLVMGTVESGGSGCVCPEHVLLKRVISHLVLGCGDVVVMDMEAGLEHLGRGTAAGVDRFITVVEPGERSLQTYKRVRELAADLGVRAVSVVANKISGEDDKAFIKDRIPEGELLGLISQSEEIRNADRRAQSPFEAGGPALEQIKIIKSRLDAIM